LQQSSRADFSGMKAVYPTSPGQNQTWVIDPESGSDTKGLDSGLSSKLYGDRLSSYLLKKAVSIDNIEMDGGPQRFHGQCTTIS
jgi:hypothetical protein